MTVTLIAFVTMNEDNPMALARYLEVTQPLMDRAGARIVQRFKIASTVTGNSTAKTVILTEYPSLEAIDIVFQSPEYDAIKPVRDQAFSSYNISMVG